MRHACRIKQELLCENVPGSIAGSNGREEGATHAYELCIGPPHEHPAAELCWRALTVSGIGRSHWLTLHTGQVRAGHAPVQLPHYMQPLQHGIHMALLIRVKLPAWLFKGSKQNMHVGYCACRSGCWLPLPSAQQMSRSLKRLEPLLLCTWLLYPALTMLQLPLSQVRWLSGCVVSL